MAEEMRIAYRERGIFALRTYSHDDILGNSRYIIVLHKGDLIRVLGEDKVMEAVENGKLIY